MFLMSSMIYSQVIEIDYFNVESEIESGEINVTDLINEYAEIMSIPEEDRTLEQWRRTNEILFIVYFKYDVSLLLLKLITLEEEKQNIINDIKIIKDNMSETSSALGLSVNMTNDYLESIKNDFDLFYQNSLNVISKYELIIDNYDNMLKKLKSPVFLINTNIIYLAPNYLLLQIGFGIKTTGFLYVNTGLISMTDFSKIYYGVYLGLTFNF